MKNRIIVLITLLISSITLSAQERLVLTLDSAKHYALEYNRELIKSGISIQKAQAQLWQTISLGLPQVNGTVDYSNYLGAEMKIQLDESMPPASIPFKATSNAVIQVTQLVFSGSYWVGIELSKLAKQIIETQVTRTELEVKQGVASAFFNILMAQEAKDIIMKNLKNLQDMYSKTEAMYKAGVAEETDVDQFSVQVMNLETTLKSTDRNIELAYNLLRLQLGVGGQTEIQIIGNLDEMAKALNIDQMLGTTMDLSGNVNYLLMQQQIDIMKKQVELQKWSYAPTVAGFYNFTHKILKPSFDASPKHVIGLQANIPIFSSGDRKNKVTEAKLNLKSAEVDIENVADQLTIQEKQLRFNLQSAYDQYLTQRKNVITSRKVFNSMKVKYEQGVISSLDLTTANSNYLQAENTYISAMLSLLQAQTDLEKLLGTL